MIPDLKNTIYYTLFENTLNGWLLIALLLLIYLYFKNIKPYTIYEEIKEEVEKPEDLGIIDLNTLINRDLNANTLSACVIELINRDLLKMDIINDREYIVRNDLGKSVSISDTATINLILNIMGEGDRVTIERLKTFCKKKRNRKTLLNEWNLWCKIMRKENNSHIFYEPKKHYSLIKFISMFGILLFIINIVFKFNLNYCHATIFISTIILVIFNKSYKRTYSSNIEYHKWLRYKTYLDSLLLDKLETNMNDLIIYEIIFGGKDIDLITTTDDYTYRLTKALNKSINKAMGGINVF